jgi:hypothetical protein
MVRYEHQKGVAYLFSRCGGPAVFRHFKDIPSTWHLNTGSLHTSSPHAAAMQTTYSNVK